MDEIRPSSGFPAIWQNPTDHFRKALKLVDAVAEIRDARIPLSSRNPELTGLIQNKKRLVLLNKCDVADETATREWIEAFKKEGVPALPVDCRSGRGLQAFIPTMKDMLSERLEQLKAKGMGGKSLRVMVVGIPNVGKSSFINRMAKGTRAKVEDRPGVTRGNQWFSVGGGLELLDTPGVLWPKFEDPVVGRNLAFTGAVKDTVMDVEELAFSLLGFLREHYPQAVTARYGVPLPEDADLYDIYEEIGRKRGFLASGGSVNTERVAVTLLDEFRAGKLGRITLERP